MPGFENRENPLDFGKGKGNVEFLKPKKENAGTIAPKSPFDFDSSTTNPFNLKPQYRELEEVYGNKPRTTGAGSNSLGLQSGRVETSADSLKTGNINYNTNNATTAKPDIKPGLYGGKPDRDYTEDLNKLKKQLPPIAASILDNSGTKIIVLDDLQTIDENGKSTPRIGRYYANTNRIYIDSKHVNEKTMLSEAIHAAQNYLKMTGIGKSNLEFQEHVIKDLYYYHNYRKTKDIKYLDGLSTTEHNDYIDFVNKALDEKGVLDLNKFLSEINYYFDEFQNHYKKSDSYQTQGVKNFNYNWIKLLHIFDIEYKY